jgi:hypothetical protein
LNSFVYTPLGTFSISDTSVLALYLNLGVHYFHLSLSPHKGRKDYVPSLPHSAVVESNLQKKRIFPLQGFTYKV